MLVALKDYNEIIRPTLHPRENSVHNEPARQIFLSSARRKSSWGYTHLKHCINNHYKNKEIKYGFFLGDVFTAVCNGILNKKQYIQAKEASDPQSFAQEYLNEFLGSSEDGIYKYEDFEKNQVVENAFQPTTVQDLIDGNKNNWAFNDNEIRWLSCDLAVATGELNDNTVLILTSLNLDTGIKRVVYINTLSGVSSIEQVKIMKRLFYDFKCQYFVFDSKGLGNVIYDLLTVETFDEEFQRTYPAWNVNTDTSLQISSDVVIQDKVDRTITSNCINCIIPIAATAEINSNLHLALRKALKDGEIQLLIDDYDKKSNLQQEDELFMLKDANEKAEILLPFVQTRYLINEAMSLEVKINENGLIRLHEAKRTQTKDRYMALTYANMFGDKLINKYLKSNDDDDIDFDELNLVF
jgi:hypothetical protein